MDLLEQAADFIHRARERLLPDAWTRPGRETRFDSIDHFFSEPLHRDNVSARELRGGAVRDRFQKSRELGCGVLNARIWVAFRKRVATLTAFATRSVSTKSPLRVCHAEPGCPESS